MSQQPRDWNAYAVTVRNIDPAYIDFLQHPPAPARHAVDPDQLGFIDTFYAYHTSNMSPSYGGRFSQYYPDALMKFVHFFAGLLDVLRSAVYELSDMRVSNVYIEYFVKIRDGRLLSELYDRFNVYYPYPLQNLMIRMYAAVHAAEARPIVSFQRTTINCLPVELVDMIIAELEYATVKRFSRTSHRYRAICESHLKTSVDFIVKYNHNIFNNILGTDTQFSHTLLTTVRNAVSACVDDILLFLGVNRLVIRAKHINIVDEWKKQYPPFISIRPPHCTDINAYGGLGQNLAELFARTSAESVRLVGTYVTVSMTYSLAKSPYLIRLVLDQCETTFNAKVALPRIYGPAPPTASNIVFLGLGFGGNQREHDRIWAAIGMLDQLRQLFVYSSEHGCFVSYPSPDMHSMLTRVHLLEYIHIRDATLFLGEFVDWARFASVLLDGQGGWTHLKIESQGGMILDDVEDLLQHLSLCQLGLLTLVLDGIERAPSTLIVDIATFCPNLHALSLVKRESASQHRNRFCVWEEPLYAYGDALQSFIRLKYFLANFRMETNPCSPRHVSLFESKELPDDGFLCASTEIIGELVENFGIEDVWVNEAEISRRFNNTDTDMMIIGTFKAACPTLEYFAIRASETVYAVRISGISGSARVHRVLDPTDDPLNYRWNPRHGKTWDHLDVRM